MTAASFLTPRSRSVLTLISRFRYLTAHQLREFVFLGVASSVDSQEVLTRRALARLRVAGLIDQTRRIVGGPGGGSSALAYFVTAAGLRTACQLDPDLIRRTGSLSGTFLMQHALAAADVAIAFAVEATKRPGHELLVWECDWEVMPPARRKAVVPDAHLIYVTSTTEVEALCEVDLGSEGSRFFQAKVGRYLDLFRSGDWQRRFRFWPTVLVLTPTDRRADLLKRATEALLEAQPDRVRLRAETEFAFASLGRLGALGPLSQIWSVAGTGETVDLLRNQANPDRDLRGGCEYNHT